MFPYGYTQKYSEVRQKVRISPDTGRQRRNVRFGREFAGLVPNSGGSGQPLRMSGFDPKGDLVGTLASAPSVFPRAPRAPRAQ
jgi:hypothetical protein